MSMYKSFMLLVTYVTVHDKTNHIALGFNLRYEPNKSPMVIIFTYWYESIEESFQYTKICFVASIALYLPSYGLSHVATLTVHDTELLP